MGRPKLIPTPKDFDERAALYFTTCTLTGQPFTIPDLATAVGLSGRASLHVYETHEGYEGYFDSIKRAKTRIEGSYVRAALKGGGSGPIFMLKAAFGYEDRKTVDINAVGEIKVIMTEKDAQL